MAISYPLAFPTARGVRRITFRARDAVSLTLSPFSLSQQVFEHDGDLWEAVIDFVDTLEREVAEEWNAFILSLRGSRGTFLLGDPKHTTPRGTWSGGSPVLNGAHSAGARTLSLLGCAGLGWEAGDLFQVGTGSSTHLHKVLQAGSQAAGSPEEPGTLEIWPALREDLADAAALVLSSPKGQWRRAPGDTPEWFIDPDAPYGVAPLRLIEAK